MTVIAEITRAETRQRARLLRVHSYDVCLDLTKGDAVFGSVSVIRFDCAEPGAASHADLVASRVHEITLNGVPVDPSACGQGRIALAGLAAHNELRVVADCAYTGSGTGMHRSVDSADGRVYTYAKFEPAYARGVYACFEQPDLKAEFTFHVTAPAHWTVLSNQPAPEPVPVPGPAGDGRAVWHFPATPPLPTYNTTVVAGDYHVVRASHTTRGGQLVPLELACRASLAGHLDAAAIFELTAQGLDFFTGLLAAGYPFAKYGQVFVPEFSAGATEDAGCVLISEQFLFRSPVTAAAHELRATVLLHEMAHMWFGDLVTMRWWDDLWLNEAFAELCGHLAAAEAAGYRDAWSTFCVSRKLWAFMADQLPSAHPVAADAPTLGEALANFDGISYAKGASVLRQLAAYAGRESFFAAIADYLAAHGWANASRSDFLRAVQARSGLNLADWSKAWLETAGPNTLRAAFDADADGAFTSFAVVQEASERHPVLRPHHIAIGLYSLAGGGLERTGRVEIDVSGPRTEVPELAGTRRADLLLLNEGDLGYAVVRLDPGSLRTVTESIGELGDPLARAVCWNTVIDMVARAEMPVPEFVAMLARAVPREPLPSVLQVLIEWSQRMMVQIAEPRWVPAGQQQLAGAAIEMLRSAEPGSDHQLAGADLLSRTATSAEQLDLVAGLLDGGTAVPGLAVNVDLRWSLLQRLAATGRADDAGIDAELAGDATDAGRRSAAACRAAIPDAAHKEAGWRLLTGGQLGVETLIAVARGFVVPEQAGLLAPYAARYLPAMADIWATAAGHLRLLLGELLFPYPAASPELLARIAEFLADGPRDPALARMLTEHRDAVQRALRSRALPG